MGTIVFPSVKASTDTSSPGVYFKPRIHSSIKVILPMLKTDLLDVFEAVTEERLSDVKIEWEDGACVCVVLASGGYPLSYAKGKKITVGNLGDVSLVHAGTAVKDGNLVTAGGSILPPDAPFGLKAGRTAQHCPRAGRIDPSDMLPQKHNNFFRFQAFRNRPYPQAAPKKRREPALFRCPINR